MKQVGYENVLKIKMWKEEETRNWYLLLMRKMQEEEKRLADLEDLFARHGREFHFAPEGKSVDDLRKMSDYLQHLLAMIRCQVDVVDKKNAELEKARIVHMEANAEKKIFEKLVARQRIVAGKKAVRKEQVDLDEHAVLKYRQDT